MDVGAVADQGIGQAIVASQVRHDLEGTRDAEKTEPGALNHRSLVGFRSQKARPERLSGQFVDTVSGISPAGLPQKP